MRILILGDSHGRFDLVHRAIVDAIARWDIQAVIQVGDFGLFPRFLHRFLHEGPRRFPVPVHVIDGNHEDHAWLHEARPTLGPTEWARANLHVHRRGEVIALGGARIGLLGGALHADRRQQASDQ